MKKFVIELLEQRQLLHIFNDSDFNYYKRKISKRTGTVNKYLAALTIVDLFIFNSKASV
jgi:hypothetical protein